VVSTALPRGDAARARRRSGHGDSWRPRAPAQRAHPLVRSARWEPRTSSAGDPSAAPVAGWLRVAPQARRGWHRTTSPWH